MGNIEHVLKGTSYPEILKQPVTTDNGFSSDNGVSKMGWGLNGADGVCPMIKVAEDSMYFYGIADPFQFWNKYGGGDAETLFQYWVNYADYLATNIGQASSLQVIHKYSAGNYAAAGKIRWQNTSNWDGTAANRNSKFIVSVNKAGTLTDVLTISQLGEILPANIHNNGGTGNASNQAVSSGTYTPTFTSISNIASSSNAFSNWIRTGNIVHVAVAVNIAASVANTYTQLDISLPVASAITAESQVNGQGTCQEPNVINYSGVNMGATIYGEAANDRCTYWYRSGSDISSHPHYIRFQYVVL